MFRIITKPIRWILRIVLGLVITALIPVFLLYKSVTPPTLTEEVFTIEEIITNELDYLIDDSNTDKKIEVFLSDNLINNEIKKEVVSQIGDEFVSDDYIYDTPFIKLQGAWVELKDEKLNIIVGAHFNAFLFTMKSRILISFDVISDNPTELKLKLNKATLGNIPLKWAIKLLPQLAEKITGQNLDETINGLFKSIGSYNKDAQEVTIDFSKIAENTNNDLLVNLVDLIEQENLVKIEIKEKDKKNGALISLDLNKLKTTKNEVVIDNSDKLNTEEEFNEFLEKKALSSVLTAGNQISFNTKDLNVVIDYIVKDMLVDGNLLNQEVYSEYNVLVLAPYFELIDNKSYINIPIRLGKGLNYFKSNIMLEVSFAKSNNNLVVNILNISLGDLVINEGLKQNLFDLINQNNTLFSDEALIVSNFFDVFNETSLNITSISVSNAFLNLEYEGLDISDMITEIINEFSNNEVKDILNDILDSINNELEYEELIDDLLDVFAGLDEAEQQELFDIISSFLDPSLLE